MLLQLCSQLFLELATERTGFFYPVSYFILLSFIFIGLGIVYLLNLILIQIIPVHRAKELMTALTAVGGILGYLLVQLPNLLGGQSDGSIVSVLPELPAWLPMQWGGKILSDLAHGNFMIQTGTAIALVLGTAAFVTLLSSILVEKGFRSGWIQISEGGRKKKKKKPKKEKLHHPLIQIGIKEWRMIQRDLREWVVLLPSAFFLVFPFLTLFFG